MTSLAVGTATETDALSLSTIVARAYHSGNEYFRTTFPDTPLMRQWWKEIFLDAMHDPAYETLTITDSVGGVESRHTLGVLLLHRKGGDEQDAAVFLRHPPTVDHDSSRYAAMLHADQGAEDVKRTPDAYLAIELLGVDDEYRGTGMGKKLLQQACEIADAQGLDIFVQANLKAKTFYEKRGFVCVDEVMLPGPAKYGQAFLIYRASRAA